MKEMEISKPAIIARLKAYRERKGPDAYRILAHYVGKKSVSSYVLQSIANSALKRRRQSVVKNKLTDLNNHLFAELERLSDEDLQGEELTAEINRAKGITGVASQIIANGTLALKAKVIADNSLSADFTVPAMLED